MEKNNDKNDFILNSKGRCYLCLDKAKGINITTSVKQEQESLAPPFPKFSLYYLSRYLKMDLRKVFSDREQIPLHLLAKVESSRLKVELCEECVRLNEQFSKIYRRLEKVEIELGSCLRRIHVKLLDASVEGKPEGAFKKLTNVEPQLQLSRGGELEILEVLRKEAFEKSHNKLRTDVPRVNLGNLTRKEIRAEKLKFAITSKQRKTLDLLPNILTPDLAACSSESDQRASGSKIKLESKDFVSNDYDDDSQSDDFNQPDEGMCENFESATLTMVEDGNVDMDNTWHASSGVAGLSSKMHVKRKTKLGTDIKIPKCDINPETGKYRCDNCLIEFSSRNGFQFHYESIHLKVRFKCVTCGKQFSQQSTCNRHQKSAHAGLRYACQVCNKSFTQSGTVRLHQRVTDCGEKLGLKSTPV